MLLVGDVDAALDDERDGEDDKEDDGVAERVWDAVLAVLDEAEDENDSLSLAVPVEAALGGDITVSVALPVPERDILIVALGDALRETDLVALALSDAVLVVLAEKV